MATTLKNELSSRQVGIPEVDQKGRPDRKHPFRTGFIVGALITVAMTMLIVQNGDRTKVEWFILDFEWPLWVVLLLSFTAGMVAWQLFLHKVRRLNRASIKQATGRARALIPVQWND